MTPLIVTPLNSIMEEQSGVLRSLGMTATCLGQNDNQVDDIVQGKYQFLISGVYKGQSHNFMGVGAGGRPSPHF